MKSVLKICLLVLLPSLVKSQQVDKQLKEQRNSIDSLIQVLKQTTNDTVLMKINLTLGYYFNEVKRDSCLYYVDQSLQMAQKLSLPIYQAAAYESGGAALTQLGSYPKALVYLLKGIKIAEDPNTEIKNDLYPENGRLITLCLLYSDLGFLYQQTGNFETSITQSRKAIETGEKINDKFSLGFAYGVLGLTYRKMNKPDSAILLQQKALDGWRQIGFTKYNGSCLLELGKVYDMMGDKQRAKQQFHESINTNYKESSFASMADSYLAMANLFKEEGSIDSSLKYAKKGLDIALATGYPAALADVYTAISSIYKVRKNADSAFIYQGLATATKDSIYNQEKIKQFENIGFDEQLKVQELEKEKRENKNKIRTYSLLSGIGVFMLIAFLLYRNNRNRKKANQLLLSQKEEIEKQKINLEKTLIELKSTQAQLIQSEKMASLGELTAGIAHEIQNPLNFVNNFSELNRELVAELKQGLDKGELSDAKSLAEDLDRNLEKVELHGKRAATIVKGMLQHSQSSSGVKELTDINKLADEYLRLAYHGFRAKDKSFNATMKTDYDENLGKVNIISQDIGRVMLNLVNNAFYAVEEKMKSQLNGYEPTVSISTKKVDGKIEISVKDNGNGIAQKVLDKIFQPFFTTKPTGKGTGLGLSLSYDIVKAHGGEIIVNSIEGEGTEFIIKLPL